eukprot:TRINITY_DN111059_c0_g1_i1.p1 TRINITY_DN111059_c0_g1~~TRINITY_DN111059_c0_g1_i1.p1  ORF type:complete len:110 (-),score=8.45 TRINITY_DN111059_c0_g1_i1:162-491(-)
MQQEDQLSACENFCRKLRDLRHAGEWRSRDKLILDKYASVLQAVSWRRRPDEPPLAWNTYLEQYGSMHRTSLWYAAHDRFPDMHGGRDPKNKSKAFLDLFAAISKTGEH